jgi:dATP pyrophosphohydrolase
MAQAPFQIVVFPFCINEQGICFALFRRGHESHEPWQGIVGSGLDSETPLEAAQRETFDEVGLMPSARFIDLETVAMIPVVELCGFQWGPHMPLLRVYAFGVSADTIDLAPLGQFTEVRWCNVDSARAEVKSDSSRTALWELHYRLRRNCA